jgi:hypothetical protein
MVRAYLRVCLWCGPAVSIPHSVRERERVREKESEKEREGEGEGERDVEYGCFIFIFKRNDGCLGTF